MLLLILVARAGIDRLVAILCGQSSIREVIAFPKSSEGRCLMCAAPAPVTQDDVDYYHLRTHCVDDRRVEHSVDKTEH